MRLALLVLLAVSPAYAEKPWSHNSEAGVALTAGNSDTRNYNLFQKTGYLWSANQLTLTNRYFLGSAEGQLSARNWFGELRYDRELTEKLGVFLANSWLGDTFAGYEYRTNIDIGAKYYWWRSKEKNQHKNEVNYFFNELGYRYAYEKTVPGSEQSSITSHIIRVYAESAVLIAKNFLGKLWIEFLPDVSDTDNYLINYEPSIQASISSYLALKMAYLGKFDNKPPKSDLKKYDSIFTTSLVASF